MEEPEIKQQNPQIPSPPISHPLNNTKKSHTKIFLIISLLMLVIALIGSIAFLSIQTPTPSSNKNETIMTKPSPTPNPTADWNTYSNTKYNWSMKYPKNWEVSSEGSIATEEFNSPAFIGPNNCQEKSIKCGNLQVWVKDLDPKEAISTPQDYVDKYIHNSQPQRIRLESSREIEIGNEKALEYTFSTVIRNNDGSSSFSGQFMKTIDIIHNHKLYEITFGDYYFINNRSSAIPISQWGNNDIYTNMLTTFRFTNQETPNLPFTKSQAISPDGTKKVLIKTTDAKGAFPRALILTSVKNSNEQTLLSEEGPDADSWNDLQSENWSPDSKYVFLQVWVPDGYDVYVFRSDTMTFSNGKKYLRLADLHHDFMGGVITGIKWISNNQIQISSNAGVINKTLPNLLLNVDKETLSEGK